MIATQVRLSCLLSAMHKFQSAINRRPGPAGNLYLHDVNVESAELGWRYATDSDNFPRQRVSAPDSSG